MKNLQCGFVILIGLFILFDCSGKEGKKKYDAESQANYGTIIGTIVDGNTGKPVPARVYAIGNNDSTYMADVCLSYERLNYGPRIGYTGRHFTSKGNTFTVHLPEGTAMIKIERGKEYIPLIKIVEVPVNKTTAYEFKIHRWINMTEKGWYSGDLHVHRELKEIPDLMITEDLNIALPQTNWSTHGTIQDIDQWLAKADDSGAIRIDNNHIFSVLSNEIERSDVSAVLMHHTGKTILPVKEYREKGLPNVPLLKIARNSGGYIDVEKPMWPESHIDVAVGKADFVGLANNHNTYKYYLPEHPRFRTEFKDNYPEGEEGYVYYVFDLYYAFLNCGFKLMPSAGSASGVLPNPLGYNRVYAKVDGEFTYDSWFEGLKAGHSFVTNGPMLFITVDGKQMGETIKIKGSTDHTSHVVCNLHSLKSISTVEIIQNGAVIHTVEP